MAKLLSRRCFLKASSSFAVAEMARIAQGRHPPQTCPAESLADSERARFRSQRRRRHQRFGAIQQAIDRCWVLGGGEVVVPPGSYLTGALALRSHTILRLEKDANIVGSPDLADYPVSQVRWEGKWIAGHLGLIYALEASHTGVVGPGKITRARKWVAVPLRKVRCGGRRSPSQSAVTMCASKTFRQSSTASCGACMPPIARMCSTKT